MSGQGVTQNTDTKMAGGEATIEKGKGKAQDQVPADVSMGEEDSSDEESGAEQEVPDVEEADEDNMEEIDTDNIIEGGRRTRGKTIDFAKANEEAGNEDYDEDDDEDFQDPEVAMDMQE
ncbi:uncharacterized protein K452DRAFT_283357 [Aplosporella prunicola CBS 121167]|uniref:Histone chaperone domain-containing protein n=1 Tax=Aplosporella prunicola CBS 121167 TaxID=1176127 RepID=A0A6A6BPR8_9PEZI|nr:uncharacterized protein K452DRAFT_283357 [Aplosporella prunicola CBS 121167]KAF2146076.1 hypothetical protein K452DRAFT_283357 [Aplosporella prunicola CBS 121167]